MSASGLGVTVRGHIDQTGLDEDSRGEQAHACISTANEAHQALLQSGMPWQHAGIGVGIYPRSMVYSIAKAVSDVLGRAHSRWGGTMSFMVYSHLERKHILAPINLRKISMFLDSQCTWAHITPLPYGRLPCYRRIPLLSRYILRGLRLWS